MIHIDEQEAASSWAGFWCVQRLFYRLQKCGAIQQTRHLICACNDRQLSRQLAQFRILVVDVIADWKGNGGCHKKKVTVIPRGNADGSSKEYIEKTHISARITAETITRTAPRIIEKSRVGVS